MSVAIQQLDIHSQRNRLAKIARRILHDQRQRYALCNSREIVDHRLRGQASCHWRHGHQGIAASALCSDGVASSHFSGLCPDAYKYGSPASGELDEQVRQLQAFVSIQSHHFRHHACAETTGTDCKNPVDLPLEVGSVDSIA